MKHLKYFETKNKNEIWKVPTKEPYFTIAKRKIGADIFNWWKSEDEEYILLHYSDNFLGGKNNNNNWTYSSVDSTNVNVKFVDSPEYMGEVEVNEEDIEKYKIEKEADKYNI